MNKLVLIGNGFDLAHGLKTRYEDFILWYFNNTIEYMLKNREYSDRIFKISFIGPINSNLIIDFTSISHFKQSLENYKGSIQYKFKSALFDILFKKTIELNWVDIESEYYSFLKRLYMLLENDNFLNFKTIKKQVIALNNDFEFIKVKLQEYLIIIESSKKNQIPDIVEHFNNHFSTVPNIYTQIMFLNFNYTSTIEMYLKELKHEQYKVNYIHGKLNDEINPIIFGYGDEIDTYYQKIENINSNEYLKNFKSFGYFKTNNYQDFSRFIESNPFKVYIMGHSCGLSDRTLLNKIVEDDNCMEIEIFYYAKSNSENDYIGKTQELSRHFSAKTKHSMRIRIKSFLDSLPLVKCKAE